MTPTHARRRASLAAMLAILICASMTLVRPPMALADEPAAAVANQWGPSAHVVVAPGASPTLKDPNGLNNQIVATGLPIYVAVTNSTPADLGKAFSAKLGKRFQGVIVAAGSHGVYAAAVETAGGNQAADIASNVAKQYGQNLDQGLHAFVVQFTQAAQAATHPQSSVGGAPHPAPKHDWTWVWILLGVLAAVIVAILVGILIKRRHADAVARTQWRKEVDRDLIRAKDKVDDLTNWITSAPVDVSTENTKATVALSNAEAAREKGDLNAAAAHIETVNKAHAAASKKVNPPPPYSEKAGARQARAVPQEDRKQATINARTATGQTVVINNNDYRTSSSGNYCNQWHGGMYNGAYFAPGYYPYSFWGPGYSWSLTDMVIADTLLEDRWGGQYDYGYGGSSYGGGDYGNDAPQDTNWTGDDTSSQGGGDYDTGQDNSDSSGGGDYSSPDPTPSYSDDSSSSSSGDVWSSGSSDSGYGGGSDYSSGGGDSGSGW